MGLAFAPVAPPLTVLDSGAIRVKGTRISLETLVLGHTVHGYSAEDLHESYPSLSLADIYAILGYYYSNKDEVDAYVEEELRLGRELQAKIEAEFPPLTRAELERRVRERNAAGSA